MEYTPQWRNVFTFSAKGSNDITERNFFDVCSAETPFCQCNVKIETQDHTIVHLIQQIRLNSPFAREFKLLNVPNCACHIHISCLTLSHLLRNFNYLHVAYQTLFKPSCVIVAWFLLGAYYFVTQSNPWMAFTTNKHRFNIF